MVLCLGEPPGGFCDVGCRCSSWIAAFCDVSFCISGLLFSCHRHSILTFQTREGFHQLIVLFLATFDCFCFSISRERYGFEWALFTHRRFFTLMLIPHIFCHNLLLSRPPWEPTVPPWSLQGVMAILETQTRLTCLFDSPQSSILILRRIRS